MRPPERVIGWDVGGAHLKASLLRGGRLVDAAEWACPLWQGLDRLQQALDAVQLRWPEAAQAGTRHAVTMTGEMVDLFADRAQGVLRLAGSMASMLPGPMLFYAGPAGWCDDAAVAAHWRSIASANWHASAAWVARSCEAAVLIDIGSTTTDLIAVQGGRVLGLADPDDAGRLASGELVYHGVVRTPLCAIAPRVVHRGVARNVMNELFSTSADVYRLTGELDPALDLHPPADGQGKDLAATRRRLARMIGLDARDAGDADWLALAVQWRGLQLQQIADNLERVLAAAALPADAPVVGAGCGDFLARALAEHTNRPYVPLAALMLPREDADEFALQQRVQVAAPSAAVALLLGRQSRGAEGRR